VTERLLTTREVAERLAFTPETVLRWARSGKLPAVYLSSRAIRFRETDVDELIDRRATPRRGVLTATPGAARRRTLPSAPLTATDDEE
jgi:excisionase family DNA binding protein